jgi:hypothetical protein
MVKVMGNYAYVVDGEYGLWIVNISDKSNPTTAGGCDTQYDAVDVAIYGNYAYVADMYEGMQVINISSPQNPYIVSSFSNWINRVFVHNHLLFAIQYGSWIYVLNLANTPSNPPPVDTLFWGTAYNDLAFDGNYMYGAGFQRDLLIYEININNRVDSIGIFEQPFVGQTEVAAFNGHLFWAARDRVIILDVDNAAHPLIIGDWENNGYSQGITLDGNYAFVADGDQGLQILNVANPANPQSVGYYVTSGFCNSAIRSGNHAYLGTSSGMTVLDISDLTDPVFISGIGSAYNVFDVVLLGDYAYLANETYGLVIANVSVPTNPSIVGHYDSPGSTWDVIVSGGYAYMADAGSGLLICDISNPANPYYVGSYDTPGAALGLALSGNYVFVADATSLIILDISDPANPTLTGSVNSPGSSFNLSVEGNLAFLADFYNGVEIIDISDRANPTILGNCNTPGESRMVVISGDYGFVADGYTGLQILDIYTPSQPTLVTELQGVNFLIDIDVEGQYAYVAAAGNIINSGWGHFNVLNISNPTDPIVTGYMQYEGYQFADLDIQGNYAYLAASTGLDVIDISQPSTPDPYGHYQSNNCQAVFVDGIVGYMSSGEESDILILNLAFPQAPSLIGRIQNWFGYDFEKIGNLLYFTTRSVVRTYDVTDPANPVFTKSSPYISGARSIAGANDRMYVAAEDSGFYVLDISDPDTTTIMGRLPLPGRSNAVEVRGNYAYVANYRNGLIIVDVSNPANPVQVASSNTPRNAMSLDLDDEFIYVADAFSLMVFAFPATGVEDQPPLADDFSLSQNYPNPFNAMTIISYSLRSEAEVAIEIFDIQGRRVAALIEGNKAAGKHTATWNANGVSSGIYFYRLRADDFSTTKKMILVK